MNSAIYTKDQLWSFDCYKLKQLLRDSYSINYRQWVEKNVLVDKILESQKDKYIRDMRLSIRKSKNAPGIFNLLPPDIIRLLGTYLLGNPQCPNSASNVSRLCLLNKRTFSCFYDNDIFLPSLVKRYLTDNPSRYPNKTRILYDLNHLEQDLVVRKGYEKALYKVFSYSKAFMDASEYGHLDLVIHFNRDCYHPDYYEYALFYASEHNHLHIVKYLLEEDKNRTFNYRIGNDPLRIALYNNHFKVAKYLLRNIRKLHVTYDAEKFSKSKIDGRLSYIDLWGYTYIKSCLGDHILANLIQQNNKKLISRLIENYGYDIHDNNDEALIEAVLTGSCKMLHFLISYDTDISPQYRRILWLAKMLKKQKIIHHLNYYICK